MEKIININGGLGRAISFSGVINKLAEKEKISLMTSYDFLFQFSPNITCIDTNFKNNFEEKIINCEYIEVEPYNDFDYYNENEHISKVFNKLITGENKFVKPKIYTHKMYEEKANQWLSEEKKNGKKIMFIQPFAETGGNKVNGKESEDVSFRSLKEDFVKSIIEEYKKDYNIYIVRGKQFGFDGTKNFILNGEEDYFMFYSACQLIDVAICCDSFLHHLLEAVDTKAKVITLWGATSEKAQGYSSQLNIRKKELKFVEPLRLPHNHLFYVAKNYGINDFDKVELEQIKKELK